jgi:hypothetical protein
MFCYHWQRTAVPPDNGFRVRKKNGMGTDESTQLSELRELIARWDNAARRENPRNGCTLIAPRF